MDHRGDRCRWSRPGCAAVLGGRPIEGLAPRRARGRQEHRLRRAAQHAAGATLRPGLGLMLVNFGYVALLSFGAAAATEQDAGIGSLVIPVFGVGVIASRTILAGIPDRLGAGRTLTGRGGDRVGRPGRRWPSRPARPRR